MKKIITTSVISFSFFAASHCIAATDSKDSAQVASVESIVRNLLQKEPQLVEEALKTSMQQKQLEAHQKAKEIIKTHHKQIFNNASDPFLGNEKASVTLVTFMDPYCGYCRRLQAVLKEILKERSDVKIVYKAYPILGKESELAAEEELVANAMGKFKDYHSALYASDARDREGRMQIAQSSNINPQELMNNLPGKSNTKTAKDVESQLQANLQLGQKLGINGTPAIIAGDTLIAGALSKDQLNELIDLVKKEGTKNS